MKKQPLTILLVDDDEITNYLSKEVLQMHFNDVGIRVAMDGEDALRYLQEQLAKQQPLPDLMLVDINMPYMNGWEFLDKLETIHPNEFSRISIFMYTSSVYFEDINRGKSHKLLKNILTKPLTDEGIAEMRLSLGLN